METPILMSLLSIVEAAASLPSAEASAACVAFAAPEPPHGARTARLRRQRAAFPPGGGGGALRDLGMGPGRRPGVHVRRHRRDPDLRPGAPLVLHIGIPAGNLGTRLILAVLLQALPNHGGVIMHTAAGVGSHLLHVGRM